MPSRSLRLAFGAAAAAVLFASTVTAQTVPAPQAPTQPTQVSPTPAAFSAELAPGVVFQVVELRRLPDQGVMQLKFTVTNKSGQPIKLQDYGIAAGVWLHQIDIIDPAGKKTYQIGMADRCLCSTFSDGGAVKEGQRREFWAWYAPPPSSSQRMTIRLGGLPPIMNVPLQ